MLDSCAPCFHALWNMWGLRLLGQYRFRVRYFVTPRRGRLDGGATPYWSSFHTQNMFFPSIDTHWILERVMIFQGWPIPGKLTIVNHHGWTSLLRIFRPWLASFFICFTATDWITANFNFCQEWTLLDFFLCQHTNLFKGKTSLGRCLCPDRN